MNLWDEVDSSVMDEENTPFHLSSLHEMLKAMNILKYLKIGTQLVLPLIPYGGKDL